MTNFSDNLAIPKAAIGILKATGEHVNFKNHVYVSEYKSNTKMEYPDLVEITYISGDKIGKTEIVEQQDIIKL